MEMSFDLLDTRLTMVFSFPFRRKMVLLDSLKRFRWCQKVSECANLLKETIKKSTKLKNVLPLDRWKEPSLGSLFKFPTFFLGSFNCLTH